jgi:predicted RNA methylase
MKPIDLSRLESLQIDTVLAGATLAAMRPRFDRLAQRHEDGTAPRAVSAFNLFQTPHVIAERMALLLPIHSAARVLEPSAGLGRLVDAVLARGAREVVAVESAPQIAAELYRIDRPAMKLVQRDFLSVTPQEIGLFDFVAMNPPFHMRADIRHILHARTFLKEGGKLAALCLNTRHRFDALRHLSNTWEELPEGTFAKEGTRVSTVLLICGT